MYHFKGIKHIQCYKTKRHGIKSLGKKSCQVESIKIRLAMKSMPKNAGQEKADLLLLELLLE